MAVIAQVSIEQVKAVADMVEIVGTRTQLRKSGARWMGKCPFHEDRTPSFSVDPADKLFYCHGCGKGGDLISFVRETEGLDFVGAIEWLADRYRIPLEYEETSPQVEAGRKRKERLLALLEQAATYYGRTLWESPAGEPVRAYLAERGLADEVCKEFRLGLSPGGVVLAQKARAKGYAQEELVASGLVNRRGNDYYAGRLVFPLADGRGRVLGFGARRLRDDDPIPAKYVNSPESELFRKSSLVYGLHLARATIAKEDRAVVVEGYTDVLALHQAGLKPVVASMGTALTEPQLKELRRLTRHLYLCFDADAAGDSATLRGMELAVRAGFDVRVVPLPAGLDPADATEGFEDRMAASVGYLKHRVALEIERAPSKQDAFAQGPRRDRRRRGLARALGCRALRGRPPRPTARHRRRARAAHHGADGLGLAEAARRRRPARAQAPRGVLDVAGPGRALPAAPGRPPLRQSRAPARARAPCRGRADGRG